MTSCQWHVSFLDPRLPSSLEPRPRRALIILNQPFSSPLLFQLWRNCHWMVCADGGANWLYEVVNSLNFACESPHIYLPDLIKGDLDSIRPEIQDYYTSHGVMVVQDDDQESTDLMKCVLALIEKESAEGGEQYDIIILGGLSGRLDQTIHTLSYLHKLRKTRKRVFAITDENIGWVLTEGEHTIHVDDSIFGPTCGLLPVGIDYAILSTTGLKWNLTNRVSSFEGMVSTSNHLADKKVWVKTSKPIWWTMELRKP